MPQNQVTSKHYILLFKNGCRMLVDDCDTFCEQTAGIQD